MRKTIELYSDKYKRKIPISISYIASYGGVVITGQHTCEDCSITEEEVESIVCRDEILIREIVSGYRSNNGKIVPNF